MTLHDIPVGKQTFYVIRPLTDHPDWIGALIVVDIQPHREDSRWGVLVKHAMNREDRRYWQRRWDRDLLPEEMTKMAEH